MAGTCEARFMTPDEFRKCRSEPAGLTPPLRAMWHDAKDDWEAAHRIAQDDDSSDAGWVHAYLHRREGDISNARYWYARAGRPEYRGSLDSEWEEIVRALLQASG
jgi:hypothetical protein